MKTIWREDDRIRTTDGTGYGDRVSDESIQGHIDSATSPVDRTFGQAVLAIREYERWTVIEAEAAKIREQATP